MRENEARSGRQSPAGQASLPRHHQGVAHRTRSSRPRASRKPRACSPRRPCPPRRPPARSQGGTSSWVGSSPRARACRTTSARGDPREVHETHEGPSTRTTRRPTSPRGRGSGHVAGRTERDRKSPPAEERAHLAPFLRGPIPLVPAPVRQTASAHCPSLRPSPSGFRTRNLREVHSAGSTQAPTITPTMTGWLPPRATAEAPAGWARQCWSERRPQGRDQGACQRTAVASPTLMLGITSGSARRLPLTRTIHELRSIRTVFGSLFRAASGRTELPP